jgi:hypothetical protein
LQRTYKAVRTEDFCILRHITPREAVKANRRFEGPCLHRQAEERPEPSRWGAVLRDIMSQEAQLCMTTAVRLSCHTEQGQGQNISTTICLFNSSINFVARIGENIADIAGNSRRLENKL